MSVSKITSEELAAGKYRSRPFSHYGRCLLLGAALLVCGCSNNVVVRADFPEPVLEKLPYTIGVYYRPEFRNHEFFDGGTTPQDATWRVHTGDAQVQMHNTLLPGLFEKVVMLDSLPHDDSPHDEQTETGEEEPAPAPVGLDAILVPHVDDLQYSVPSQTKVNVFEIWLRYRYKLYAPDGKLLADWLMTSYGKTPTAFLQSAEAGVNAAATIALRDAGANFATNLAQIPEVKTWMNSTGVRQ